MIKNQYPDLDLHRFLSDWSRKKRKLIGQSWANFLGHILQIMNALNTTSYFHTKIRCIHTTLLSIQRKWQNGF